MSVSDFSVFMHQLDSEGKKFGKSEGGVVWLSPEKVSPYKFYQQIFTTTDSDVIRFMKILTFLPLDEIKSFKKDMQTPEYVPNTAQRRLAEEVTRFVHGEEGLQQALRITEVCWIDKVHIKKGFGLCTLTTKTLALFMLRYHADVIHCS